MIFQKLKRPKTFHATAIIVAATFLTAGCAQTPRNLVGAGSSQLAADPHDTHAQPAMLNDHIRMRDLTVKAAKLLDDGKTTSMETLTKQLDRKQCKLSPPQRLTKPLTRPEIYSKNVDGVLIVAGLNKCKKCTKWHASPASGFAITASGAVATNHHIFENKENKALVAMTRAGKIYPVKEVLAASKTDDAVILQLDMGQDKLNPLPLAPNAPVGSEVTVISHPNHHFYSLTGGLVSRYSRRQSKRGMTNTMAITADFAKGSSGAAVFDACGNVAAMVASTSSVYYTQTKDTQKNLQMVFKQCVPAASILKLFTNN